MTACGCCPMNITLGKKLRFTHARFLLHRFKCLIFSNLVYLLRFFLKAVKLSASLFMLEKIAENLQSKKVLNVFAP